MVSIAIDGPAGAGKSTIAKEVSKKLGYIYVDTGALYRAVALYCLEKNLDVLNNEEIINNLCNIDIDLKFINREQRVILCEEDVSDKIRSSEISMLASSVSAIPKVREFLFSIQRNLATKNNVIMDGRDIGTVVLPNANIKIFLTASAEERAMRRYNQMQEKGDKTSYEDILNDIKIRDYNDSHRSVAPLKAAEDAIVIDTTGETLEESINRLTKTIEERL